MNTQEGRMREIFTGIVFSHTDTHYTTHKLRTHRCTHMFTHTHSHTTHTYTPTDTSRHCTFPSTLFLRCHAFTGSVHVVYWVPGTFPAGTSIEHTHWLAVYERKTDGTIVAPVNPAAITPANASISIIMAPWSSFRCKGVDPSPCPLKVPL